MLTKNDPTSAVVENRLADFEQALAAPNDAGLRALFPPDCHWRDVLALTWTIQTLGGRDVVVSALKQWAARARPKGFRIAANASPQFHKRGNASPAGTITISDSHLKSRRVIVNITGRVRVD